MVIITKYTNPQPTNPQPPTVDYQPSLQKGLRNSGQREINNPHNATVDSGYSESAVALLGFATNPVREKFALIHTQSGIRIARNFTREEIEKLEDWSPPDIAAPKNATMRTVRGRHLLKAIDAFLDSDIDWDVCRYCGSLQIDEILTPELIHYAKLECGGCGRWLKWLPSSESAKRLTQLRERVDRLLPNTRGWDLSFLKSIAQQIEAGKKLSSKQIAQVERIAKEQEAVL